MRLVPSCASIGCTGGTPESRYSCGVVVRPFEGVDVSAVLEKQTHVFDTA